MKEALIVSGGWEGHEPKQKAEIVCKWLEKEQFKVKIANSLDAFAVEELKNYRLLIPIWSAISEESISKEQAAKVVNAVAEGVGIAGFHNGMCSFPGNFNWNFMTGAHWVAHPGGMNVSYTVNIKKALDHPIIKEINDFEVCSEQFYLHVDPAAVILASTRLPVADGPHAVNGVVDMPVAFMKKWGKGRIYYCSLGHLAEEIEKEPISTLISKGLLWAANEF